MSQIPLPHPPSWSAPPAVYSRPSLAEFRNKLFGATPRIWATHLLLACNIGVYLLMVLKGISPFSPTVDQMIHWGAGYGPETTHGQHWRLFTEMFLHFGIVHISMNMLVLWQAGPLVERLFGNTAYLAIYILSGLFASLISLKAHPMVVAAGASGAIFGVYGALLSFLVIRRGIVPVGILKSLLSYTLVFVGYNIVLGAADKGTDIAAHMGGLFGGLVLGSLMTRKLEPGSGNLRRLVVATTAAVMLLGYIRHVPPLLDVDSAIKEMNSVNDKCMSQFIVLWDRLQAGQIAPDQFNATLENQILPPFRAEHKKLETLTTVPDWQQKKWQLEMAYIQTREDSWNAMIAAVRHNSPEEMERAGQLADRADNLYNLLSNIR